jgi:ABC-type glycerol-3-phosphate transport system substrate-binding protein
MTRTRLARWIALGLALTSVFGAAAPGAATREVVVLTSFPKELFEAYKQAFEQRHPGVKVVVKQQQTNAAVTYLRETRAKPEADIFWVSAVDAFQTLKADGLLDRAAINKELLGRIPPRIGSFPLHDPDGHYFGFAVSGYGLMWNTRYLILHKLPPPRSGPTSSIRAITATS